MTTARVVKTSVTTNNSLSEVYSRPDDHTRQRTETPGFKPFPMSQPKTLDLQISASHIRSNSALLSLSVGSIIRAVETGHDTVGAWKPVIQTLWSIQQSKSKKQERETRASARARSRSRSRARQEQEHGKSKSRGAKGKSKSKSKSRVAKGKRQEQEQRQGGTGHGARGTGQEQHPSVVLDAICYLATPWFQHTSS